MVKHFLLLTTSLILLFGSTYGQQYRALEPVSVVTPDAEVTESQDFLKGIDKIKNKAYDEAVASFEKIIEEDGDNAVVYINIGVAQFSKGDLIGAKKSFDKAIEINGALHWAWYGNGHVSLGAHKAKEAEKYFRVAYAIDKSNQDYKFMYGVALKENFKYEQAIAIFEELSEKEDFKSDALLELGNVYALMFEFEKSMKYYEEAETAGASSDIVALNMAKVSTANKANDASELNAYIKNHPDDSKGLVMRGNYYFKEQQYKNAIEDFSKALQVNEKEVNAYNGRAAAYLKLAEYEKAVRDCNQALDLDPNFSYVYYNRGIAKEMLRDVEGACYDWQNAFFMGVEKAEEFLNSPTCNEE